jgi:hypothetical protein
VIAHGFILRVLCASAVRSIGFFVDRECTRMDKNGRELILWKSFFQPAGFAVIRVHSRLTESGMGCAVGAGL